MLLSVTLLSAMQPLPRWTAPRPHAQHHLGGYGRLPHDFAVSVCKGDNATWLGTYNHNSMMDYMEGSFLLYWKNSAVIEDFSGQRVLGSVSADAKEWSPPVIVFPNLTTGNAAAVLEPAPPLLLNGHRYAAASPGVFNTSSGLGWHHVAQGSQCALWPDSLDPRNCGPAASDAEHYERNLLLRRWFANGTLAPHFFWAASKAPALFALATARLGIPTVDAMDEQTRFDVATLRQMAQSGTPPCDASKASLKCEWCPGEGCPAYDQIPFGLQITNERSFYVTPPSSNRSAEVVLFRSQSSSMALYASIRTKGAAAQSAWSRPALTTIPNVNSNLNTGVLANGSIFLAHNPLVSEPTHRMRDPLTLAVSDDGLSFSTVGVALTCLDLGVDACRPRFHHDVDRGPSYPQVVVVATPASVAGIYIAATNNKEDVVVVKLSESTAGQHAAAQPAAATQPAALDDLAPRSARVLANASLPLLSEAQGARGEHIEWHALLANFQPSPAMVPPGGATLVSWGWTTSLHTVQVSHAVSLYFVNGSLAWASGTVATASQQMVVHVPLCDACLLSWTICITTTAGGTGCAPPQPVFTAPITFLSTPLWAPNNETGGLGPQFTFLRAVLPSPPSSTLASALIFITADGPGCLNPADRGNKKLLAGYKLWMGSVHGGFKLVGIGPGRSKCDTFGAGRSPQLCPGGIESVYDGYDVTSLLAECPRHCGVFIEAYGFDQHEFNVSRRVLVELRMRYTDGQVLSPLAASDAWSTYDADDVYLRRLWEVGGGGHSTAPSSSSGGGSWYYSPHEYTDTASIPAGTPLSYPGSGREARHQWRPAQRKASFPLLVVRDTPPVEVLHSVPAASIVPEHAASRFSFDMGREVQGGVVLEMEVLAVPCAVELIFGEELMANGSVLSPMRTGSNYMDSWALAAGQHVRVEHHEYIEGRYGELRFGCGNVTQPRVSMWVVRAPYRHSTAASLSVPSEALSRVWELTRYTSEATSLDLLSDSNARQRSADCMADDTTAMRLSYATSSQLALQRYAMQQALTVCGTLIRPGSSGGGGAQSCHAEWIVLTLVMVRDDALHTGDLSFARQHFDALVPAALAHLIDPQWGLVKTADVLVDWPPGQRDRFNVSVYNAVANAFAYRALRVLVELAAWLSRPDDAARHAATAERLRRAINHHMWNGSAFCDGICSLTPHTAFHSSAYLLAFGAVNQTNRPAAWRYVRDRISSPVSPRPAGSWPPAPPVGSHDGMPCSSYVAQYALEALYAGNATDHGLSALRVLESDVKHSWLHMMARGATTTMEAWDTDEKPNLTWSQCAAGARLDPWATPCPTLCRPRPLRTQRPEVRESRSQSVVVRAWFCHRMAPLRPALPHPRLCTHPRAACPGRPVTRHLLATDRQGPSQHEL